MVDETVCVCGRHFGVFRPLVAPCCAKRRCAFCRVPPRTISVLANVDSTGIRFEMNIKCPDCALSACSFAVDAPMFTRAKELLASQVSTHPAAARILGLDDRDLIAVLATRLPTESILVQKLVERHENSGMPTCEFSIELHEYVGRTLLCAEQFGANMAKLSEKWSTLIAETSDFFEKMRIEAMRASGPACLGLGYACYKTLCSERAPSSASSRECVAAKVGTQSGTCIVDWSKIDAAFRVDTRAYTPLEFVFEFGPDTVLDYELHGVMVLISVGCGHVAYTARENVIVTYTDPDCFIEEPDPAPCALTATRSVEHKRSSTMSTASVLDAAEPDEDDEWFRHAKFNRYVKGLTAENLAYCDDLLARFSAPDPVFYWFTYHCYEKTIMNQKVARCIDTPNACTELADQLGEILDYFNRFNT